MRNLDLPSTALAGLVAFYAIVHFELNELSSISRELRRVVGTGWTRARVLSRRC
jgi:hypothetical protein